MSTRNNTEEKEVPTKRMFICQCSPNNSFKSESNVCPKCNEPCLEAEVFRSKKIDAEGLNNPQLMKASTETPKVKVKAYTEMDYRNGNVPKESKIPEKEKE